MAKKNSYGKGKVTLKEKLQKSMLIFSKQTTELGKSIRGLKNARYSSYGSLDPARFLEIDSEACPVERLTFVEGSDRR